MPTPRIARPWPRLRRLFRPALALALGLALLGLPTGQAGAQPFQLPTRNRALFEPGGEERFFVGTVGKPWTSGTFGCVRTDGWQLHEGLDIRAVERDRRGEPVDPILCTADGTVAYVNRRPSLSNYGNYLIVRHFIEGLEVYSLYAHLSQVRTDLQPGKAVQAGEELGIMGRTSNTGQGISKERAHVHFEFDLVVSSRFPAWYKKTYPNQRNDHGGWNGQNLLGLDPRQILLDQQRLGPQFSLVKFLRSQPEMCRVLVRARRLEWNQRYPALLRPNPVAEREGTAGFELALNYIGIPFAVTPRAASEIKGAARIQLLSVNEAERDRHPCRKLVQKRGTQWHLGGTGERLLDLLTY